MGRVKHLRMEAADNGFKINYDSVVKGMGDFGPSEHIPKELVYKMDEKKEAMDKFMELAGMGKMDDKSSSPMKVANKKPTDHDIIEKS
jgi:hypothetical protein